jgi:hypothetical protein
MLTPGQIEERGEIIQTEATHANIPVMMARVKNLTNNVVASVNVFLDPPFWQIPGNRRPRFEKPLPAGSVFEKTQLIRDRKTSRLVLTAKLIQGFAELGHVIEARALRMASDGDFAPGYGPTQDGHPSSQAHDWINSSVAPRTLSRIS